MYLIKYINSKVDEIYLLQNYFYFFHLKIKSFTNIKTNYWELINLIHTFSRRNSQKIYFFSKFDLSRIYSSIMIKKIHLLHEYYSGIIIFKF